MKITITKKYLVFPVSAHAKNKFLYFCNGDKVLYDVHIKLDYIDGDLEAYIDVARYIGMTLELKVEPEIELHFRETDEMELTDLYQESLRPQIHFTAKNGWINDPNGLIYMNGVYHMFYQYNPIGNHWDNMHWGHAVSTDLIHWEEQDIALFIGEHGNIFSGSAILDQNNILGKNSGNEPALLLYYTATAPVFTQRLAYSVDCFKTIREYAEDPIIPHMVGANRDPSVVYCEEMNCYVMALYLIYHEYALLRSDNLRDWEVFQKIEFLEEAECPDLFPIRDISGEKKWVLMGATDRYLIGQFNHGQFVIEQEMGILQYGSGGYAGQSFSNLPNGRVVRVCWDRWDSPSTKFTGQMGIPLELTLTKTAERYFLCAWPVDELESLYDESQILENVMISAGEIQKLPLKDGPYVLRFNGRFAQDIKLKGTIFGCEYVVDFRENQLVLLGVDNRKMPVSLYRDDLDLLLVVDRHSLEFFADKGKGYMAATEGEAIPDRNLPWLTLESDGSYCFDKIELHTLKSIWV